MAIGHARILNEIEKYTAQARSENPAKMRESVAAIRALCNLLLDDEDRAGSKPPRAMPLASPAPQISLSEKKMQEEDANGDSLFEF